MRPLDAARSPYKVEARRFPPWRELTKVGFSQLVALQPGNYDPSPLRILCAEKLQDLAGGGIPRNPVQERDIIVRIVQAIIKALRAGEGVAVHCVGGRGRTGSVLGCVLCELGYSPQEVIHYLDRVHKSRGKEGWPESLWQADLVRTWRSHVCGKGAQVKTQSNSRLERSLVR